jgi:hypothetical protein
MTDVQRSALTPSLIAGIACTAIALAGCTFLLTLMAGWLPGELAETAEEIALATLGIVISGLSLWIFIRWLNRRHIPSRFNPPDGLNENTANKRKISGAFAFAAVVLYAVVATAYLLVTTRTASLTDQEVEICEAIFLHELSDSGRVPLAEAGICLEVRGLNPPAALLWRLQRYEPRAKHRTRFREGDNVLFKIGKIQQTGTNTAAAFASCYVAGDVGWGRTYFLVKQGGQWTVSRTQLQWVS